MRNGRMVGMVGMARNEDGRMAPETTRWPEAILDRVLAPSSQRRGAPGTPATAW